MKKLFVCLSVVLVAFFAVSCDREDPIDDGNGQQTAVEDPFKDYPRLESVEITFGAEDTRIQYDGLVEVEGVDGNTTRYFKSSFDYAKEDVVIVVAFDPSTGAIYEYPYKPVSGKWVPVNTDAPYDANFKYTAYWFGSNDGTKTFEGVPVNSGVDAWKNKTIDDLDAYILQEWINATTRSTDQGTLEKFKAADFIMPYNVSYPGNNKVAFNLEHKMGLAVIHAADAADVYSVKYLTCDEYYRWVEKTTYNEIVLDADAGDIGGCIPYRGLSDDWYYLWVTPKEFGGYTVISADNAWSRTLQISSGKFQRLNFTKTITEPYVLTLGDIYYDDGSLTHNGVIGTGTSASGNRKALGIVVSLEGGLANPSHAAIVDDDALDDVITKQKAYQPKDIKDLNGNVVGVDNRGHISDSEGSGYHALVMALKDAITVNTSYFPSSGTSTSNNGGCAWQSRNTQVSGITSYNTIGGIKTDYAGYQNTQTVYNNRNFSSTRFPAFYAVKNYSDVPADGIPATDWFIASSGQWCSLGNQIFGKEPGNTTMWKDTGEFTGDKMTEANEVSDNTTISTDLYVVYGFFDGQSKLNTLLENAGGKPFDYYVYWSSTIVRNTYALTFAVGSHNELALGFDHPMKGKDSYFASSSYTTVYFDSEGNSLGSHTVAAANWETVRGVLCF